MKHIVFKEDEKDALKSAQKEAQKSSYKSQLLQIFTGVKKTSKITKIVKKLKKAFPNALIIGTSTAGEIAEAKMYDKSTVISLSLFKSTTLKAAYSKQTTKKSGAKLLNKIATADTKAVVIVSEGLLGEDYEGFIRSFSEGNPDIVIAGGLAGDNFKLKKTVVILDDKVYEKGSVALSFSGKLLQVDNQYNLNWTPIGKEFTITKSEGNTVYEIDHKNSVALFKEYLGASVFYNNAEALSNFQLLYREGETTVSRTPLVVQDESLIFAAPLKEGQKVQFGFSNGAAILEGANSIKESIAKKPAEAIYIYSCIARKRLLGKVLERELDVFNGVAPAAGFFTYGEYYSTKRSNALLNCTTTLLLLSESKKVSQSGEKVLKQHQEPENTTFNALTHFIEKTSEELRENLKLIGEYRDVVDSSLLVSKTDLKGNISYVNDRFCEVSGYAREELLGKNHNIIRDKSLDKSLFKGLWKTIKAGKMWKGEFSNRRKDGTLYYVSATIMPTYDEHSRCNGYMAVREDITESVIVKQKMAEKEQFIQAIFDNQESIVILSNPKKGMIYANETLFDYFDFKNFDDFKSKHKCICELFIDEEGYIHPQKDSNWAKTILNNPDEIHKAKMLIRSNEIHTFRVSVKMVNSEYITNLTDITMLEDALQQAYASEKAKSTFLANMSHEIRTPLNGILGFTDVLRKRSLDGESSKYVDIIHRSGATLLSVVNDILDFSKLESGELALCEEPSDLFKEMETTVSIFASISREKKIEYYTYIDTNIPKSLQCDIQRVKQVVNNLISNAIKFTSEGGTVRVSITIDTIKKSNATIHFSIKDSGIGIPKNKQATIFQPFLQADNSISRKFGGTGLGLSISSDFVKMMGGKLEVRSEENKGSEFFFTLTLPIVDASNSLIKHLEFNEVNINVLHSESRISCRINDIIETYLKAWKCNYKSIHSLDEVEADADILIVCAKLFEKKSCMELLESREKLELLYIEGSDSKLQCSHKQFHLIEQPMTGSDLFDKIVTLTQSENMNTESSEIDHKSRVFDGTILIAEDNEVNQMLISLVLDERTVEYKVVANGQEAVDEALVHNYDLILMDINMPILDGVSATKILRKKGYKKPIVSLSANVIESDKLSFIDAGMNDTLNKPIEPNELDIILERYLQAEDEDQEDELLFDTINVERLQESLMLPNGEIVLQLLKSFASSATSMIDRVEEEGLNKETLHSIKGMAGNLRFTTLYELTKVYEEEFQEWSEEQSQECKKVVIAHLQNAIKSIESLG